MKRESMEAVALQALREWWGYDVLSVSLIIEKQGRRCAQEDTGGVRPAARQIDGSLPYRGRTQVLRGEADFPWGFREEPGTRAGADRRVATQLPDC